MKRKKPSPAKRGGRLPLRPPGRSVGLRIDRIPDGSVDLGPVFGRVGIGGGRRVFRNGLHEGGSGSLYFSTMTAYALVMYEWKLRNAFFSFIMGVMMIPSTVTIIGFFQMVYKLHMTNHLLTLILPAIASPSMVFFMRQYMKPSVSVSLVESARIDGSREFWTFNVIVLPIMKPAIATQAIFTFVTSWNELFRPSVILTQHDKYTLPIMVSLLNGDIYKREHGAVYVGLSLTALPLIIVYFLLAKYIVAGVALGSVKG